MKYLVFSKVFKKTYYKIYEKIFKDLYIDPDIISYSTVFLSFFFYPLYLINKTFSVIVLLLILLLDGLDGYFARKANKNLEEGWIKDTFCDRFSEMLIIIPLGNFVLNLLLLLNLILSFISYKLKINIIVPLRHIILLYLLYKIFI